MFPKLLLARFGSEPEAATASLVRQLELFGAPPEPLLGRWLTPLKAGGWSPAEVTEHVLKVNIGISKTLRTLRQSAPLPAQLREPGQLVGGHAQSPAFALPGEPQTWEVLLPRWQEMQARFLAEVEATHPDGWHGRTRFHPYFGDLDALAWVQSASLHMAHHRKQLTATFTP